ncbi:MAG: hypothetical protein Q7T16_04240 [Candidatus Burarchaeum sp.]|nr:radical SAM protein [Candidatus Burarchaeum sp.]MDO8339840.1 hypothetical protein [Candidatus Burarchaeum sp.]
MATTTEENASERLLDEGMLSMLASALRLRMEVSEGMLRELLRKAALEIRASQHGQYDGREKTTGKIAIGSKVRANFRDRTASAQEDYFGTAVGRDWSGRLKVQFADGFFGYYYEADLNDIGDTITPAEKRNMELRAKALRIERLTENNFDGLVAEMVADGLLVKREKDLFEVNINRIFEILGGKLAEAYANPELYSSPDIFSPPAERKLHVIRFELTQGCEYNRCTYCGGYEDVKCKEKTSAEFDDHFEKVKAAIEKYPYRIERAFLGGANALGTKYETLKHAIRRISCEIEPRRLAIYGRADAIIEKGVERLGALKRGEWKGPRPYMWRGGLDLIYWGVESGSRKVLDYVNKGVNVTQMILAGQIAKEAGIGLSIMIMPGLGGMKYYDAHISRTVTFLNSKDLNAQFITFMAVNPGPRSRYAEIMAQEMADGTNRPLTDREIVEQMRELVARLKPRYQKIGMFGCGIDQVGKNPITFNERLDDSGRRRVVQKCDVYLKTARAIKA